jgi:hypothetical protein
MNLKTATDEALASLCLPDEALVALAAGQEWEYTPDSIEGADADVYWCDDCGNGTYHMNWSVWGLRLDADGVLYETLTLVDTDGNWDFADESPYGEFDHDKEHEEVRNHWRSYAQWVALTGLDPVGEFSSFGHTLTRTIYTVQFASSIVGPRVVRVRKAHGKYAPLSEQPGEVRTFFEGVEEFKDIDDMRARAHGLTWTGPNRATFEISRYDEKVTKAEIRRRAARCLTRTLL